MKRYCNDCKYYYSICAKHHYIERCRHPSNIKRSYSGNRVYIRTPNSLNRDCNCKYYRRKGWKFWIKK